jgi:NCAIR mutase (PurE)-related protein
MTGSLSSEVRLDFGRAQRIGLDEAVFAQCKSAGQLDVIFAQALERSVSLLVTRLDAQKHAAVSPSFWPHLDYCAISRTAYFGPPTTSSAADAGVAIVAAGSSDAPVAREAERTLRFSGVACPIYMDVGVAGLWRLYERLEEIRSSAIIIAVAGMDAALPTVLGGLIPGLIIAVPTSVGYGVAAGGQTALNAVLASCAPGITVTNIDNGYGAACAALRALRMLSRSKSAMTRGQSNESVTGDNSVAACQTPTVAN